MAGKCSCLRITSKHGDILLGIFNHRYSTSARVSGSDALIQDFYARETQNPVYLTVDTTFQDEAASIKAYVSTILTLGERQLAAQFHEVQLDLRMVEAERVGCNDE